MRILFCDIMEASMNKPVVFVSGSGRGIGKAIAIEFAKKGHPVIINAVHDETSLEQTKQEILSYKVPCLSFLCDIKNYTNVQHIFEAAKKQFGNIDILVNNAGIAHIGLFQDMTPEDYNHILQTNLISALNCCHVAIPDMIKAHHGHIVNISSVWGNVGASCEVVYSASKGGLNSFTKALAKELAPSNIQVNAVSCGLIDTDMNHCLNKEDIETLCADIPAGRMGKPEEIARFVYELATGGHNYLTGQIITLDGGWI